ncbi:hypothetical protein JCM10449v2_004080 [Rhodotorula kratochvilovae]
MATARRVSLVGYINRLCDVWVRAECVTKGAREGKGEYRIGEDGGEFFVIHGNGTPDHPFLVAVASLDHTVYAILQHKVFKRFQVPYIEQRPAAAASALYTLAGPSPIGHDSERGKATYGTTYACGSFIRGTYGNRVPCRLDTEYMASHQRKIVPSDLLPPGANRKTHRVIWSFTSPAPRTHPIEKFVENPEHPDEPLTADKQLREGSRPASKVGWTLDIDIRDQDLVVFQVVYCIDFDLAVARARAAVMSQAPARSLAKEPFTPGVRGQQRAQTLQRAGW